MTRDHAPCRLRVEHLDEPFGIDVTRPRFSWHLPTGATRQLAYRLRVGAWDSGRVESDASVLVPYGGAPLWSRQRVASQVKVWSDAGASEWTAPAWLEMGLLSRDDWSARWIEPVEHEPRPAAGHRRAQVLRTSFRVASAPTVARLYATAHGVYELFLNATRVGDMELTPGFTSYAKRLQVQTYDVAALLRDGSNELRAIVSDGWWRGQVGFTREHDVYGRTLAVLAQLEADGTPVAVTGSDWTCAPSAIVEADLIEGQHTDLRIGDAELEWTRVRVAEHPYETLVASPAPPVRRVETIRPRAVTRLANGAHIVDLGQNINGWIRLTELGPRGTAITITHGEVLDATGNVTLEHLRPFKWGTKEPLTPGQVDVVTSDGEAEQWEPRHAVHGFRYARVEGLAEHVTPDNVTGVVVHTDLRRTGWFHCSDVRLNRLHDIAEWSFRTNACDIPTDCPQRERAGWTGDWQLFAATAAFLYDVAGFSTKWLRDLAVDQRADGAVRNFAPDPAPPGADDHPVKTFLEASAGWGDAAVHVPWTMWRCYGDARLLEEQWPSMVAWVEYQATTARDGRHASRVERSSTPQPHEQFLWDTGFHWGEWTEPDAGDHFADLGRDLAIIATAYFARSARELANIGRVLGRDDDAARYATLADRAVDAWRSEFLDEHGNVRSDRQADHVRALAFGLVPDDVRPQTASRLVALIRAKDTHLDTGFLATPFLLPALAGTGHLDLAYELILRDTRPAWLPMVNRGATTIWEDWDGIDDHGEAHGSLNHYSKGAVVSFLHEHVAGIQLQLPAYRHFRVAPQPGGGLTWARAAHESPYGRIESAWSIIGSELRLEVRVPPATTADVVLPDGATHRDVAPGTAIFTCPAAAVAP